MKLLTTFVLSVLFNMGAQAMAQETEYQFGVRWSVNGLASSVDVQDIMLDFSGTPSHRDTLLPLSQYIKNGENMVKLYTWPLEYEPDHELRVSLLYWEPGDNPNTDANTAFEVVMMPGQDNAEPEIISVEPEAPLQPRQNGIRFNRNEDNDTLEVAFNNRQQMPTWCWEEGDVLRDNDATRDSLTREYRRIHELFAAANNDALLAASSTRTKELALASDTPEAYVRDRFSYTMYFDNPDLYQLNPFPDEPMTLNLGADNHIAWLTEEGVNEPIRFNNMVQEGRSAFISLYFIRRDGQWEICR